MIFKSQKGAKLLNKIKICNSSHLVDSKKGRPSTAPFTKPNKTNLIFLISTLLLLYFYQIQRNTYLRVVSQDLQ